MTGRGRLQIIYKTKARPAMATAPTPAILPLMLLAAPVNVDGLGEVAAGAVVWTGLTVVVGLTSTLTLETTEPELLAAGNMLVAPELMA